MTSILKNKVVEPEPLLTIREKCANCLKGPNIIKTLVVILCVGIALQQITSCVRKLIDIPIMTYTHFDFNKTIMYPSVTFCREPPYKFAKLREYGLFLHPHFTSEWRNFNFSVALDELWRDITYDASEFFVQFGLNHEMHNLEVKETIGFIHGRCYTLTPQILMTHATRESGLSITLQHNAEDVANGMGIVPPGYHVYVHYSREPFTEVNVHNGGLVEYIYSNVGETIEMKLTVNQYKMITEASDPCTDEDDYNANNCTTQCVWQSVSDLAGCSGPWMESDLPPCDNYESMKGLIIAYLGTVKIHNCSSCPRFCNSFMYNGYVTDRHTFAWNGANNEWIERQGPAALQTQVQALLFIYFNSMMVSVYEERYNYDWNLFISDLGGSVGFLLGLSVIGLMSICSKFLASVVKPIMPRGTESNERDKTKESTPTENIYQNQGFIDACHELNMKNYHF